jgi:hypothetical protein
MLETCPKARNWLRSKESRTAGLLSAPEWTRTTTEKILHKALNLARLPIPPRAQSRRV